MPRYLWDPEGLPEIEELELEEEIAPAPETPRVQKKKGIRARLNRWLREGLQVESAPEPVPLPGSISKQAQDAVEAARIAWKDAERYFENVSDPDLVRFAAYEMEAARRKYLFLLKNAHKIT